ncbi:hypothetical protein L226DRAFT_566240 [Lentinus tigrinus ALCF2SS1-7]|uniref:Mid2 domain-containing protein n=1 Tax=Lentinus tigrinus ALCF2SS1-6 TaxID=1328759 RepID=A0A5C2SXE9_9APHY|nr:hypothetical protein L227DRAFT_605913 [Lentinus tigrinus ALCF2SS1-6]RPD81473.1 hypothetical protein L226DRAFT_566240 [Lentinus tigrinus ALCF2SS1-7]
MPLETLPALNVDNNPCTKQHTDHDQVWFKCQNSPNDQHQLDITNMQGYNVTVCVDDDASVLSSSVPATSSSLSPTDSSALATATTTGDASSATESEGSSLYASSTTQSKSTFSGPSTSTTFPSTTISTSTSSQSTPQNTSSDPASVSGNVGSVSHQNRNVAAIVGGTLSALAVIALIVIGLLLWRRHKRRRADSRFLHTPSRYRDDVSDTTTVRAVSAGKPGLTTWSPEMFHVPSRPPTNLNAAENALAGPRRRESSNSSEHDHDHAYLAEGVKLSSSSPYSSYSSYSSKPLLFPPAGSESEVGEGVDHAHVTLHHPDKEDSWNAY